MVTVCTPTYNRGSLLEDLYQSLKKQTLKNFEWLIVDDGSTDNTEKMVHKWIAESTQMSIRYFKKENGGKHTALNVGIENALGKYFAIVDSDDYLKPDAIEMICAEFDTLPEGKYAGIGFLKFHEDGECVGTTFHGDYLDCTSLQRVSNNINGDKAEVFFTEVLKKYPFPVFENERFLTEAVVWNRIAHDGYMLRWVNRGFYLCRYQENGLSMNAATHKAFLGYTLFIKELLSYEETIFTEKVRWLGVYTYTARKSGMSLKEIKNSVEIGMPVVVLSVFLYWMKTVLIRNNREKKLHIKKR